jgi:hypothetical protein
MKLKLKTPLVFGKKTIEELTFRDYTTAGDYLAFDTKGGVAQEHELIANLTGTDKAIIEQLRGPDYRAAARIADEMILADSKAVDEENPEKKPSES